MKKVWSYQQCTPAFPTDCRVVELRVERLRSKNCKKLSQNYSKLFRNKNTLRYKNYKKSIVIFWFAQKGNSLPSEQNKIYINNNIPRQSYGEAVRTNPSHGSHGYCTDCFLIKTEALSQLQEVVV